MATCVFAGTLHRAAIDYRRQKAVTGCGVSVRFNYPWLDAFGEFTDQYAEWVRSRTRSGTIVLCCHCRDREPVWERARRKRRALEHRRKQRGAIARLPASPVA